MIRIAVLPYCRSGIVGGAMLGLGRAIGETIAVTILIGDAPQLSHHLFEQGYSLAAVIANEFGEAQGLHRSALFAAGLVLFVLTLLVNGIARVPRHPGRARNRTRGPPTRQPAASADVCSPTRRRAHERAADSGRARWRASPSARRAGARTRSLAPPIHDRARCIALIPLVLIVYYLLSKGLELLEHELLHDRPHRQHVLRKRRASAASRARSSARSRSSRSPR